jgi:hypothetical protein
MNNAGANPNEIGLVTEANWFEKVIFSNYLGAMEGLPTEYYSINTCGGYLELWLLNKYYWDEIEVGCFFFFFYRLATEEEYAVANSAYPGSFNNYLEFRVVRNADWW